MSDGTDENLMLLAEWELRRDLQNHVAAERKRIRELAALTHRLEQALHERDRVKSDLDFLIRSSRDDIAVLRKLHEFDILAIWHEATDATHPPQSVQDVLAAVRKLRQERNAANRDAEP